MRRMRALAAQVTPDQRCSPVFLARILVLASVLALGGCSQTLMSRLNFAATNCVPAADGSEQGQTDGACHPPHPDEISHTFDAALNGKRPAGLAHMPVQGATPSTLPASSRSFIAPNEHRAPPITHPGTLRLSDAVAYAVMTFPEIRVNEARVREARAGIGISESGLYPNAEMRLAAGNNFSGSYEGKALPYGTAVNGNDVRFDGNLMLRQLIYDFGATRSDVERAALLRDSETHKLREKIDEIAAKTAQMYIRLHEQRALLRLVDETIASHNNLLKIVQAQEKEGHSTIADVSRVKSRLVDVGAIRADVSLQLMSAEDQFERLTRNRPLRLGDVPNFRTIIPLTPMAAISQVLTNNPRLAAMEANKKSTEKELEHQKASNLPRFNLEVEGDNKNYRNGQLGRSQMEARAMFAMRLRLFDGGLAAATEKQIKARIEGSELSLLNEREQIEADVRQAYRAIDSANRKGRLIADGVVSAKNVRELYLEQFKGGKRTIFELLDGQMAYYTSRRAQIESQYEAIRAVFEVLRATGELTRTLAGQDHREKQDNRAKQDNRPRHDQRLVQGDAVQQQVSHPLPPRLDRKGQPSQREPKAAQGVPLPPARPAAQIKSAPVVGQGQPMSLITAQKTG